MPFLVFKLVWFSFVLLAGNVLGFLWRQRPYFPLFCNDSLLLNAHSVGKWRLLEYFLALGIHDLMVLCSARVYFPFGANVYSQNSFPPLWFTLLWVRVATLIWLTVWLSLRFRYLLAGYNGFDRADLSYFAGANLAVLTFSRSNLGYPIGGRVVVWVNGAAHLGFFSRENGHYFKSKDKTR